MNDLQFLIFLLDVHQKNYEEMKGKVIKEAALFELPYIKGVLKGLKLAITAAEALNNFK